MAEQGGGAGRPRTAEAAYREYQRLLALGERVDLDDFCKRYPDLEDAIRALHSMQGSVSPSAGESTATVSGAGSGGWDVQPGDRVGPYSLTSVLGEGGFGTVFLADQERPIRRQVALKVLKAGMDTREIVARFENERQALALMSHAGIAKVHDAGATDRGRPYFVMEYVPGEPITRYCDRKGLDIRARLGLFIRVCDAVQHAHQKAIIHRDLKPSNVLVVEENGKPAPKIIDFGIAKVVHRRLTAETLFTVEGQLMGTPEYMSPEQAEMANVDVDTRADIYSLGVLLYEILSGTLPFDSKMLRSAGITGIPRILREVEPPRPSTRLARLGDPSADLATKRATDPRSLARELEGDLDCIVMKAMAKEPSLRYASASELASDIERHLRFEPVVARPPSLRYRAGKFLRRNRVGVGVAAAVLAALLLAAAVALGVSEFRRLQTLDALRGAIAARDLPEARALLAVLEKRYPGTVSGHRLRESVADLERSIAAEASARIREDARETWKKNRALRSRERALSAQWAAERERVETWVPVWERRVELATWGELTSLREQIEDSYNQAVRGLHEALQVAPDGTDEKERVRKVLEDAYWERYLEAKEDGEISFAVTFLEREILTYGTGAYTGQIRGGGKVALKSTPAGARAYCFRFKDIDGRRVPIPYSAVVGREDATAGMLERPVLEVDRIWDSALSDFEAGDRLLDVNGRAVRTYEDLAASLRGTPEDRAVQVRALRREEKGESEKTLAWTPFPSSKDKDKEKGQLEPGRLLQPFDQLGLTFRAFPLAFRDQNLLGVTREEGPLTVDLPRGSYLFVLQKDGYVDTRVPISVPDDGSLGDVQLLKDEEIPRGFVYVPAGPVRTGGDPKAFQSLAWGTTPLKEGFFMGLHEVTIREWLAFVNDPEVLRRTNLEGELLPRTEEAKAALEQAGIERLQLIPSSDLQDWWRRKREQDPWVYQFREQADWPAFGISHLAAVEYADWRTRKQPANGKRWRYRLPTDLEWERAARGVDRRTYVWGDYLVWSFCLSQRGLLGLRVPRPVGSHPFDESVFGIRDLGGSVCEHTTGKAAPDLRNTIYRGGSWQNADEEFFHVASRNSLLPEELYARHSGLRLAADLQPLDSGSASAGE